MTQILIIGYVWPEPSSSAAGTRMMELIELFLQQNWHITFSSPAAKSKMMADLTALGVEQKDIELNNSSFDDYIKQLQPDIVLFDRFMMEEQFGWRVEQHCPQALRILETSDLHSLRHARQLMLKDSLKHTKQTTEKTFTEMLDPDKLFQIMASQEITQREIAAIYRSDFSLMISDFEIALLTQQFSIPDELLLHCPFMIDPPENEWADFDSRQHFIHIGNFLHSPNWDSVLWLKQAIWPLIRKQMPTAELHIYGAYTPEKATVLHQPNQGFHIKGWAKDALQVMSKARVCLAPLRFGAGIKGKLADAMICGTPNVTTPIGAEAMHGDLAWSGIIASDEMSFADAAITLYQNKIQWQQAQFNGHKVLKQKFNKLHYNQLIIEYISNITEDLPQHRLNNFTGSMLRHHHHKSTQYMAQWIEAKNRHIDKK